MQTEYLSAVLSEMEIGLLKALPQVFFLISKFTQLKETLPISKLQSVRPKIHALCC